MVKVTLECTVCQCRMDVQAGGGMNNYYEKIGKTVVRPCQGCEIKIGNFPTMPNRNFKVMEYQE